MGIHHGIFWYNILGWLEWVIPLTHSFSIGLETTTKHHENFAYQHSIADPGIDRDLSDKNSKFGMHQCLGICLFFAFFDWTLNLRIAEAITLDEDHLQFVHTNVPWPMWLGCHRAEETNWVLSRFVTFCVLSSWGIKKSFKMPLDVRFGPKPPTKISNISEIMLNAPLDFGFSVSPKSRAQPQEPFCIKILAAVDLLPQIFRMAPEAGSTKESQG